MIIKTIKMSSEVVTPEVLAKPKMGKVNVFNWENSESHKDLFIETLKTKLLPYLDGENIDLFYRGGDRASPSTDSKFEIFLYSRNRNVDCDDKHQNVPHYIFGEKVCSGVTDAAYNTSGTDQIFIDQETGFKVGELFNENKLFIFYHMGRDEKNQELDIYVLKHILKQITSRFLSEEERQKIEIEEILLEKERAEKIAKASEEAFVKACSGRLEKTIKGTEEKIKVSEREIARLQQQLIIKVRETLGLKEKLEQIKSSDNKEDNQYRKEYKKFLTVPDIKKVEVHEKTINVFTKMIYINHDNVKYRIGEFRIEMFVNGHNDYYVKFFNLTNKGQGPGANPTREFRDSVPASGYNMHHPHVSSDGIPCLGNIATAIPQLIGEYQYAVAAIIAIQFLKSVNAEDSAGRGIYFWPKAESGE